MGRTGGSVGAGSASVARSSRFRTRRQGLAPDRSGRVRRRATGPSRSNGTSRRLAACFGPYLSAPDPDQLLVCRQARSRRILRGIRTAPATCTPLRSASPRCGCQGDGGPVADVMSREAIRDGGRDENVGAFGSGGGRPARDAFDDGVIGAGRQMRAMLLGGPDRQERDGRPGTPGDLGPVQRREPVLGSIPFRHRRCSSACRSAVMRPSTNSPDR